MAYPYLPDLNLEYPPETAYAAAPFTDLSLYTESNFFDFVDVDANGEPQKESAAMAAFEENPLQEFLPRVEPPSYFLPAAVEEAPVVESEADKKRRNTAASARFRIKKKMREQEMENKAKEMTEKLAVLEARVKTLEMENRCLKNMVVQKTHNHHDTVVEEIKKRSLGL